MLKTLCYFNLLFTVVYFLEYLQNSSSFTVLGIFGVILFNWLILRGLEINRVTWGVFHWLTGISTLLFAVFTGYSAILLGLDAVSYRYYPFSSILLIFLGLIFSLSLLSHVFISFTQKTSKKED